MRPAITPAQRSVMIILFSVSTLVGCQIASDVVRDQTQDDRSSVEKRNEFSDSRQRVLECLISKSETSKSALVPQRFWIMVDAKSKIEVLGPKSRFFGETDFIGQYPLFRVKKTPVSETGENIGGLVVEAEFSNGYRNLSVWTETFWGWPGYDSTARNSGFSGTILSFDCAPTSKIASRDKRDQPQLSGEKTVLALQKAKEAYRNPPIFNRDFS